MTSGYSGTPLARKLSLKDGMLVWWDAVPAAVAQEIGQEGIALDIVNQPDEPVAAAHVFVTERAELETKLNHAMRVLEPSGFIWVSWPKKASKVPTDITEDVIRDVCLPMGLVDVKVCAIDATWSGLKLMRRRAG